MLMNEEPNTEHDEMWKRMKQVDKALGLPPPKNPDGTFDDDKMQDWLTKGLAKGLASQPELLKEMVEEAKTMGYEPPS